MSHDQIRADFAVIDQAGSDLGRYAGSIESYRDALRSQARIALGNFGGGAGSSQHEAAMRVVDDLVDQHVSAVTQQRSGLGQASDSLRAAGIRMRSILGAGAG